MKLEIVRAYDLAIDREAMKADGDRWERFLEERDLSLLTYLDGETPAKFVGIALSRSQRRELDGLPEERKRERAFMSAIKSVSGYKFRDGGSPVWSVKDPSKAMRDHDVDRFAETDVQHVGMVVIALSFCPPDSTPYVPLLVTCRDALIAAGLESQRRHAERTKRAAAPSGEGSASPPATQTQTP